MPPAKRADEPKSDWYCKSCMGTDGKPYRSTLWLFDRGIDAVKAGRLLEAIELFKQCARRRTRDHSSAYNLACCYSLLGDVDMGLWWLRKAVRCG